MATYFSKFDEAEKIYRDVDRRDLNKINNNPNGWDLNESESMRSEV